MLLLRSCLPFRSIPGLFRSGHHCFLPHAPISLSPSARAPPAPLGAPAAIAQKSAGSHFAAMDLRITGKLLNQSVHVSCVNYASQEDDATAASVRRRCENTCLGSGRLGSCSLVLLCREDATVQNLQQELTKLCDLGVDEMLLIAGGRCVTWCNCQGQTESARSINTKLVLPPACLS